MSEKPVNIEECGVSAETEVILRNLGNFPIHIRQNQRWSSPSPYTTFGTQHQPFNKRYSRAKDPDPHSFSLLDPDPGRKNLRGKKKKIKANWYQL